MTLLTIEGFETRLLKSSWSGATTAQAQAGRFGGIAYSASQPLIYTLSSPAAEVVCGFATRPTASGPLLSFASASGLDSVRLEWTANRAIELRRGPSTLLTTSAASLVESGVWCYVEVKAKIADVGGYCRVRVNGAVVLDYTGDTHNFASGDTNITQLTWNNGSGNYYDDMYVCDVAGAEFNDFLGEVQVLTLSPNGNGAFSQLAGSDANNIDNYALVDELPAVDTDHVQSATVGQRDTYAFTDPAIAGQYLAVQASAQIAKTTAGDASMKLIERLANGTERVSAAFAASNLRWVSAGPKTRDPENAAWTQASVTASQFGVEVA